MTVHPILGISCKIPTPSAFWAIILLAIGIGLAPLCLAAEPAAPPWLGSRVGISDALLSPWTPVEVSENKVAVWGRSYEFGGLPFPSSVVTRDAEVLASPIVLSGAVGGKRVVWTAGSCRAIEAGPSLARLATRAESEHLRCEGVVRTEYDGMIRCGFELVPKQKEVSLDRLTLEIPIKAEHARYLHHWPGKWGSAFNSSSLPKDGYRGPFKPFVWLGDEWRGLAWFCESDHNFFNRQSDRVIEIRLEGDVVVLRVNLITERQMLEEALEYTFGLQATPVKPAQPDVWDYRICHMGAYGLEDRPFTQPESTEPDKKLTALDRLSQLGIRTICFHEQWTDIQAYPKTTHGAKLRKLVDACHERNLQLLLYLGYEMSTIAPEWEEYHEKCLVHPRRGGYKRKYQPDPDQTAYVVCYRSPWQDFIAYHLDKLLEEYGIDGVYLDGTSEPWGCRNVRHGCGYVRPDGTIGPTYPIFDTRSMMKRIYTIVRSHKPRGQVNVHQSTCMTIPTLAFATSYWDGEQLQSVARRPFAQEVLPLDAFRCEFMGHNWGVPAELLHYASGPFKRFEAVSLALLHDVLVRPSTMANAEVSASIWKAMDTFGRKEATWLPYWENQDYVRTNPPGVKVSIYNRPGKGLIAVIANMGREKCSAQVTFNLATLRQPPDLTAHSVLAKKETALTAGQIELPLESMGFAMVWLKAE